MSAALPQELPGPPLTNTEKVVPMNDSSGKPGPAADGDT
jgi:hypothetical protein